MYYVCSFRCTLFSSFCAFLSFWALILVGVLLLHREVVFTSARFFLTADISQGTLCLALFFVGMHSAAASMWALTMFSNSSFGVGVSHISWSAWNLFLSDNVYIYLISLLLTKNQSMYTVVVVRAAFLRRVSRIFAVTIRWSEDTPSKEEYALLLFHFLLSICALALFAWELSLVFPFFCEF